MVINNGEDELNLRRGDRVGVVRERSQPMQTTEVTTVPITEEMVQRGPLFSQEEVNDLVTLLNKYRCCFAFNLGELGCTTVIQMDIVDDGQPVVCKPYRASASERDTISRIVREWKDAGIVKETSSPYASPVLLVSKKDGDARLVVDYRKLNSQTVRKVFPTPNLDEHLERLQGAKMFTTLDI
ncbi:unnamed protein product [Macrosiphum euphorbiae]|uniref:Uncharacterized protein n=1 Tax=Macrosiphum euphorbiae TaxID=13131 RepID=A0AAV0W2S4_9HEMI|nr:unnamed protein product [Macrosiphum euphorbiae]